MSDDAFWKERLLDSSSGRAAGSSPVPCSAPTVAELIDHIQGMRNYYTGPIHQPSPRCVCRGCIDMKLAAWRKAQNTKGDRT